MAYVVAICYFYSTPSLPCSVSLSYALYLRTRSPHHADKAKTDASFKQPLKPTVARKRAHLNDPVLSAAQRQHQPQSCMSAHHIKYSKRPLRWSLDPAAPRQTLHRRRFDFCCRALTGRRVHRTGTTNPRASPATRANGAIFAPSPAGFVTLVALACPVRTSEREDGAHYSGTDRRAGRAAGKRCCCCGRFHSVRLAVRLSQPVYRQLSVERCSTCIFHDCWRFVRLLYRRKWASALLGKGPAAHGRGNAAPYQGAIHFD